MPKYKYDSAQEWLIQRIDELVREGKAAQLSYLIRPLVLQVDADTIQDLFQDDMNEDGFFVDLDEMPEGYTLGHDVDGYFIVEPGEEDPDEDGYSLGFDGRQHYATEEAAREAAHEFAH